MMIEEMKSYPGHSLAFRSSWLIAALASLMVTVVAGCEKDQKKSEPPIRPVKYQVVEASGGVQTHTFSGQSSASSESKLSFKVTGTLNKVNVKVGDVVKKGKLIAELDRTDYQLQVQQARASYSSARAQQRNAEANYARIEKIYETGGASRSDLDAARAGSQTARANVSAASQQVNLAKQKLSYTRLEAPIEGKISQVAVEINENVSPGQPVVLLASGDKIDVSVAVADKYIRDVKKGATVTVKFSDIPDKSYQAVVSEISPTSTGSGASVTVTLNNTDTDVRPGLSAETVFTFGSENDEARYYIPSSAVGEDGDGMYVYLVDPADKPGLGTVRRQTVKINPEPTADGIQVLEGIADGQLVVTAGRTRISNGLTVKVPEKKTP